MGELGNLTPRDQLLAQRVASLVVVEIWHLLRSTESVQHGQAQPSPLDSVSVTAYACRHLSDEEADFRGSVLPSQARGHSCRLTTGISRSSLVLCHHLILLQGLPSTILVELETKLRCKLVQFFASISIASY